MLRRHSLVWLTAAGWDSVQRNAGSEPIEVRDAVARWRAAGWPLVVRRNEAGVPVDQVCLALALPPHRATGHKPRIATSVARDGILRHTLPLTLASVLQTAPQHWRAALLALHLETLDLLPPLRVYGSLAWQAITGMPYLRQASDIDLLYAPTTRAELVQGIALLQRTAGVLPLDGEVVFPSGAAVAWKEWGQVQGTTAGERVLAKQEQGVALTPRTVLLATLDVVPGDD